MRIRSLALALAAALAAWPAVGMTSPAQKHQPAGSGVTESRLPQSGSNLERPPTWRIRSDRSAADREYVVMRPGWHVHPGTAAILWDPGRFASGTYSVTSTIFLFPAGQGTPPSRVDAPYGLVVAGHDLDGATPTYVTFLIDNEGRFRLAQHSGDTLEDIVPWTAHEAIVRWTESSEGTAENVLGLDLTETAVTCWINDVQVATVPRGEVPSAGLIGLRAGEGLSLHVTDIVVGPNRR